MNKCDGCGVILQTVDKEKLGYISDGALLKDSRLCMRCFNIKNYSKNINKDYTDKQFIDILKNIDKKNLIVMIVDIFDLNSTLLTSIIDVIKNQDILLFVNKIDILPDTINVERLLSNVVRMYQDLDLNIVNGALVSAKCNFNIEYAKELIDMYSNNRDTYIVGVSNVGKSMFLKSFLKSCDIENKYITVSHFPATTINTLKFKYNNNYIYDTPGVINRSQIIHYIKEDDIKYLYPKKLLQTVLQLRDSSVFFVSGFLKVEVNSKDVVGVTLFCSSELNVHRRKSDGSEGFYKEKKDHLLVHTYIKDDLKMERLTLKKDEEVAITGLCWFKVNTTCNIVITLHKNVGFSVRNKLI
ncbi:MAG: GTPase [Bacilli bacterium]